MLLGKKIGMTQVHDQNGRLIAVTVIQAGPCKVMQVKTEENDGYSAVQLGYDDVKRSRVKKPQAGHAEKSGGQAKRFVREMRVDDGGIEKAVGDELTVSEFEGIEFVDVKGVTKGKGFAGVVKRFGFKGQLASHGVERKHRSAGGIGSNSGSAGTGRGIRKGKKMAGHMGHVARTSRSCRLISIDEENDLLLVGGSVPGPRNGYVVIATARTKGAG